MQVAEMNFLSWVDGISLRDRSMGSDVQEEVKAKPLLLHVEKRRASENSSGTLSGCLKDAFLQGCVGYVHTGGDSRADQGHTGDIIALGWLGSALHRRCWGED